MSQSDFEVSKEDAQQPADTQVSPNNPCPFLRALVAGGYLSGHVNSVQHVADTVVASSAATPNQPQLPRVAIIIVAMIANGLSFAQLLHNLLHGVTLDALRGGPLDKRGVGSRILDATGHVDQQELDRLNDFASDKTQSSGTVEMGLSIDELRTMMDANFERAKGSRRYIDRPLMNGEWPILLKILGKPSNQGSYLSLSEIRTLFLDMQLPQRITQRLQGIPSEKND